MKYLYVDTSVLVNILAAGERARSQKKVLKEAHSVLTSSLTEAELLAVAKRKKIDITKALQVLDCSSLVFVDRKLSNEFDQVLEKGHCRGADLFHIGTALFLDPTKENVGFFTLDKKQAELAQKVGFFCVPA